MTGVPTTLDPQAAHAALTSMILDSIVNEIKDGSGIIDASIHTISHITACARTNGYTPAAITVLRDLALDTATELITHINHAIVLRDCTPPEVAK
jgi:hypothetical protein